MASDDEDLTDVPQPGPEYDDEEMLQSDSDVDATDDYAPLSLASEPHLSIDELETKIRLARESLFYRIIRDDTTLWDQETTKEAYREEITELVKKEKSLRDRLISESGEGPRPNETLLQYILHNVPKIYPQEARLDKVKFLVELVASIDPVQMVLDCKPKPLHIAAKQDHQQHGEFDLTHFLVRLLGPDAAAEISIVNEDNANILHLAIQNDLNGVEEIIDIAETAAFLCERKSESTDDGNTPLHDAVGFEFEKKFWKPRNICDMSLLVMQHDKKRRQSSVVMNSTVTATAVPNSSDQTFQQQSNPARPRTKVVITSGHQKATITTCEVCIKAWNDFQGAYGKRLDIIQRLINKNPDAITKRNSAGLSPYLYLKAAREEYMKKLTSRPKPAPTNGHRSMSKTQGQLHRQGTKPQNGDEAGEGRKDNSRANRANKTDEMTASHTRMRRDEEKADKRSKKQAALAVPDIKIGQEYLSGSRAYSVRTSDANGPSVKQPVKNKPRSLMPHQKGDLKAYDIGSDRILSEMKDKAFELGDYAKVYECLFQGQDKKNPFSLGPGFKRSLSLEGRHRVNVETTNDFDFFRFEPTMASVVLSLDMSPDMLQEVRADKNCDESAIWALDEENLQTVFSWLKEQKQVKTIISLTVKDNPFHFCSDNTVEQCLKGLEVMYLNWNRPNICVNLSMVPNTLVEIDLYWTGLTAILWGWSDTQGLRTLKKLKSIKLHVPQTSMETNVEAFKKRVIENWPNQEQRPVIDVVFAEKQQEATKNSNERNTKSDARMHSWMKTAQEVALILKNKFGSDVGQNQEQCHVKIALLDDGVDPNYKGNGAYLHHTGWPLVDSGAPEDGTNSFYVSTNQHGSKMAFLIRSVCPFVTIYVAKLGVPITGELQGRKFNLTQATDAVKWATEQNVDIISMSWNLQQVDGVKGNTDALKTFQGAIEGAAKKKILLFGAACDIKESSDRKWYPCDYDQVWSIGATDTDYDAKKYVHEADYLFPGEHVLDSELAKDIEVGNSGATALGAALAGLVISCMRISKEKLPDERKVWMDNIMSKMFANRTGKKVVVRLDNLLAKISAADGRNPLAQLVQSFAGYR